MLRAYVDEAGDRGVSATATDFFGMSAVVVSDTDRPAVQGRLAAIRNHLSKPPGTVLHFAKNIRQHGARRPQDLHGHSSRARRGRPHRRVVPPFVYVPGQGYVPNPDPRPKSKMR